MSLRYIPLGGSSDFEKFAKNSPSPVIHPYIFFPML